MKLAREEAERLHGPLAKRPFLVTDNGSSFLARKFTAFVTDQYRHVRIQYRMPQQLGLLERFHATLKTEEVYWRLYEHPQHARRKPNGMHGWRRPHEGAPKASLPRFRGHPAGDQGRRGPSPLDPSTLFFVVPIFDGHASRLDPYPKSGRAIPVELCIKTLPTKQSRPDCS